MFSVLMSIYKNDKPAWLKESIDSLLNQTLKADEILIVKDGPLTPALENVLSSYEDPSIRHLAFDKNRGQEICLKEGLLECKHELIARMDSDDVCHPDRFRLQYLAFQQDPTLDVVGTSIIEFDETVADAKTVRILPLGGPELRLWAKRRSPTNHAAVMYKKQSVIAAGNYQDFLWNEDYHLWARMLLNGSVFKNLPEILLFVRGGQSMYERRGGLKYALQDYKLQIRFYNIGFLSLTDTLINLALRIPIRILPNALRRYIYETFLRKK
jgi:glycosyltransferase involved in cell wall biosynthesis